MSKLNRLHTDQEIKQLALKGKVFFLPQFTVKYQIVKEPVLKIGFVVSTKIDKRATVRNKLKRQMREASRKLLPTTKKGYLILVVAKKAALDLDFQQICKQLEFAFKKIKVSNIS